MTDNKEYKRSLADEIDWKIIDQLHTATLNFSMTSLELKKIFFVLLGIAIPTLVKLASDKLDRSLFISIYIFTIAFWFLDSFTFFYQERLREGMDKRFALIESRNREDMTANENKASGFTLGEARTKRDRVFRSALNPSVWLYGVLLILNTLALALFLSGKI